MSARTQDVGEARESLPAPYAAEPMEIGFNADFLRDGLESIDFGAGNGASCSQPAPPGGAPGGVSRTTTYLIMPIRLAG